MTCKKSLAPGQWWGFCGETDMGQTLPVQCTACGGVWILKDTPDAERLVIELNAKHKREHDKWKEEENARSPSTVTWETIAIDRGDKLPNTENGFTVGEVPDASKVDFMSIIFARDVTKDVTYTMTGVGHRNSGFELGFSPIKPVDPAEKRTTTQYNTYIFTEDYVQQYTDERGSASVVYASKGDIVIDTNPNFSGAAELAFVNRNNNTRLVIDRSNFEQVARRAKFEFKEIKEIK